MSSKPLLKEFLFLLNVVGLNIHKFNYFNCIKFALSVTVLAGNFLNVLLEFLLHFEGLNSVEAFTASIAIYQLLMKLCTVVIHRNSLYKLLENMNEFWDIDRYGLDLKNEIESIYASVRRMTKLMMIMLITLLSGFTFQTFFGNTKKLMFQTFFPRDVSAFPGFELAVTAEFLMMFVGSFVLLGFDGLLISLIIHVICELKLLKKGFEIVPINADDRNDTKEALNHLYEMINHHNLILECIAAMKQIYTGILLNVYAFNMGCICAGLLGVIMSGLPPTVESMSKYGILAIYYIVQLFFYCFSGNYLITESQSVSTAVYNTDWWIKTQPELRRACALIILRANKLEELTAGGMFSLSLDSFRTVLKGALSFFTLINAVYKDEVGYKISY